MTAIAVIPARYASTRFPGKPLARDTGRYLVQHVYEQASAARCIDRVLVATDDARIAEAVASFGGQAVMTAPDCPSGTDRIAQAARQLDADIIVNVQGDEPEIDPAAIDRLVECMAATDAPIGTLACPFAVLEGGDPRDSNAVKVVLNARSEALYFSRAMIPHPRGHETAGRLHQPAPYLLHLGIYAYRRATLLALADLPPTPLERTEQLEQLRWLEHGYRIAVALVEHAAIGIDSPEDYAEFVKRHGQAKRGDAERQPSPPPGNVSAATDP